MVVLIHSTDGGGGGASEKTASLYVLLSLTHADWLSWPCRWTTFDVPRWPLSGGKGYWTKAADCNMFYPKLHEICYWIIMVFLQLCSDPVERISFVHNLEGTLVTWNHFWQLICQSLCFPLYLSNGQDVCDASSVGPSPSLPTIDFLCVWQAPDLVSREETFSRTRAAPTLHLPYLLLLNI